MCFNTPAVLGLIVSTATLAGAVVIPARDITSSNATPTGMGARGAWQAWQAPFGASARGLSRARSGSQRAKSRIVHITDPQLGMLNQYKPNPQDWTEELAMFRELVRHADTLEPDILFIGGDMQNYWPNEAGLGRNKNSLMPRFDAIEALQRSQVYDIKAVLEELEPDITLVYTPGNHDIGDDPDDATVARYLDTYKQPLVHHIPKSSLPGRHPPLIVQINSQFYQSDGYVAARHLILQWFKEVLSDHAHFVSSIVILTHVPPFMNRIDEGEGWGNWKKQDRRDILAAATQYGLPVHFICGHFHANVHHEPTSAQDAHVYVTSASGSTIQWDGKDTLTPAEAEAVASMPVKDAFAAHVGFANINQRIQARKDRAGLGLFDIDEDGSIFHVFLTVQQLEDLEIPVRRTWKTPSGAATGTE